MARVRLHPWPSLECVLQPLARCFIFAFVLLIIFYRKNNSTYRYGVLEKLAKNTSIRVAKKRVAKKYPSTIFHESPNPINQNSIINAFSLCLQVLFNIARKEPFIFLPGITSPHQFCLSKNVTNWLLLYLQ